MKLEKTMQAVTAVVLGAFVLYGVAVFQGWTEGNFPLALLLATVVTGAYWLAERYYFAPQRRLSAQQLEQVEQARRQGLEQQGIAYDNVDLEPAKTRLLMQPWWLDWTAGLFPVIVVVFILRSFLFEPFKIPSGSMIPTLQIGDLILVNKFTYGIRLPVLGTKITQGTPPQRGDVMVFHFPPNPKQDFIKRVVGLPGDTVEYINKRLTINGQTVPTSSVPDYLDESSNSYSSQFEEQLSGVRHFILNDKTRPAFVAGVTQFPGMENCSYFDNGVRCTVPQGQYFMMGDNRDNSLDSRYWGFVPDANIVGKAFFVWMNFGNLKRIGSFH